MPVHRQKNDTAPKTPASTQEQTAPALPEQQTDPSASARTGPWSHSCRVRGGDARGVRHAHWSRLGRE